MDGMLVFKWTNNNLEVDELDAWKLQHNLSLSYRFGDSNFKKIMTELCTPEIEGKLGSFNLGFNQLIKNDHTFEVIDYLNDL